MESYPRRYLKDKKYSQDDLIPMVVLFIGANRDRATKKYVEEGIYELFREEFSKSVYQEKVANDIPRWKHDIAWARNRAKKIHGYIKPPTIWSRGLWELSEKGKAYYQELVQLIEQSIA